MCIRDSSCLHPLSSCNVRHHVTNVGEAATRTGGEGVDEPVSYTHLGVVIKQFWGLPYAMAAVSKLTGLSDRTALLLFSLGPSLLAGLLARRLWGGWIAGYFVILNFDWMQRSCLGGSEPLFVCLLLGTFVAVRRRRWLLASLLASFATVVRPLGLFVLLGIGLTLLWKRDFRRFTAATAIGLFVGVLYALPVAAYFRDPLANVNSYHSKQWAGGWLSVSYTHLDVYKRQYQVYAPSRSGWSD